MRVLLVNPSQSTVYGVPMPQSHPPLGLLYVGASLENGGHRVRIVDEDMERLDGSAFAAFLRNFEPQVVGLTATTPVFPHVRRLSRVVKEILNVPVMVGGVHPTIASAEAIAEEAIDIVVRGEGDVTVQEVLQVLASGGSLDTVKGITFRGDGTVQANPDRDLVADLDGLPFPGRHLLKRPYAYKPPDVVSLPATSIMTSRGCPHGCTYCCTKQILGRRLRFRSVSNVLDEMQYLVHTDGIREIQFMDDCFTARKDRVLAFRDAMKKIGLRIPIAFGNGLRADQVDEETLIALKEMGVYCVGYGVESGNQEILNRMRKNLTLGEIRNAFRLSKRLGFETWGFFMIGVPGETPETVQETVRFSKELDPDFAKFIVLKPYPGSEVHRELSDNHLIFTTDYTRYGPYLPPVHHLPGMDAQDMEQLRRKANRAFYLRPRKMLDHLLRIRSIAQLKRNLQSALFILKKM